MVRGPPWGLREAGRPGTQGCPGERGSSCVSHAGMFSVGGRFSLCLSSPLGVDAWLIPRCGLRLCFSEGSVCSVRASLRPLEAPAGRRWDSGALRLLDPVVFAQPFGDPFAGFPRACGHQWNDNEVPWPRAAVLHFSVLRSCEFVLFFRGLHSRCVQYPPVLSSSKLEDHFIVKVYSSCLCFYDIVLSYLTRMFLLKVPSFAMVLLEDGVTSLKPAYPQ